MTSAKKVILTIIVALAMILPFALLEVYFLVKSGFSEPYSYFVSVPLAIFSFFILQVALGYGAVKGWSACNMRSNYFYLASWVLSLLTLLLLPQFFSGGPLS